MKERNKAMKIKNMKYQEDIIEDIEKIKYQLMLDNKQLFK
jgi:hypothetical protein